MRLHWTAAAQADLEAIVDYLLRENPAVAGDVVARIDEALRPLRQHPGLGRPGRMAGTRERVISGLPYIVPYQVCPDRIVILRVLHTARQWPERF